MNYLNEDLARAEYAARLGEARHSQRRARLIVARRRSRKAAQAALTARLALARAV